MPYDPDLNEPADAPCGRIIPRDPDANLYPLEAAYISGQSPRTLEAWRLRGGGPPFIQIGRSIRYRRGDLLDWLAKRRRISTSDPGSDHRPVSRDPR